MVLPLQGDGELDKFLQLPQVVVFLVALRSALGLSLFFVIVFFLVYALGKIERQLKEAQRIQREDERMWWGKKG